MKEGPDKDTSIMRNFYRIPQRVSIPFFIDTNYAPKTDVSTVGLRFDNQTTGAIFKNIKKPVRKRRVSSSLEWSKLTYKRKSTSFPITLGFFPIAFLKGTHINLGVSRVETHPCVVLQLHVTEDMIYCFKMSLLGKHYVRRQHRQLRDDIDAPELAHPP